MFKRVFLTAVLIMALLVQVSHAACLKPIAKVGTEEALFDVYDAKNLYQCIFKNEALFEQLKGKEIAVAFNLSEIKDGLSGWRLFADVDVLNPLAKIVFRFKKVSPLMEQVIANAEIGKKWVLVGTVKHKTMGFLLSIGDCWLPYKFVEKGITEYHNDVKQAYEKGLL